MHDPMTLAFTIRRPWPQRFGDKTRWWPPLISIWHVDPERGGSDDSCGWSFPHPSKEDHEIVEQLLRDDMAFPYFSSPSIRGVVVAPQYAYPQLAAGDALAIIATAWRLIAKEKAHRAGHDHGGWKRLGRMPVREWNRIVHLATYPPDNIRGTLVDQDITTEKRLRRFLFVVMRCYNQFNRPWWKHPRWHIHHWRIQFHKLQWRDKAASDRGGQA